MYSDTVKMSFFTKNTSWMNARITPNDVGRDACGLRCVPLPTLFHYARPPSPIGLIITRTLSTCHFLPRFYEEEERRDRARRRRTFRPRAQVRPVPDRSSTSNTPRFHSTTSRCHYSGRLRIHGQDERRDRAGCHPTRRSWNKVRPVLHCLTTIPHLLELEQPCLYLFTIFITYHSTTVCAKRAPESPCRPPPCPPAQARTPDRNSLPPSRSQTTPRRRFEACVQSKLQHLESHKPRARRRRRLPCLPACLARERMTIISCLIQ